MTECLSVLKRLQACCEAGRHAALALVIDRHGSAPRGAGAMLALDQEGRTTGTVGGGSLEHEVVRELASLLHGNVPRLREFDLKPEQFGMPCGGRVVVLLTPVLPEQRQLVAALADRLEQGASCCLHVAVHETGEVCWSDGFCTGQQTWSVSLEAAPQLMMFGAGHIAQALAPMALSAGFGVTVLDDRRDYVSSGLFCDGIAARPVTRFDDALSGLSICRSTALLIATYGHLHDLTLVRQALKTEAGYIGMVGSRRKRDELFARLQEEGVAAESLARVRCPVGLAIGAETPAEIAVSILAEMIAVRRNVP